MRIIVDIDIGNFQNGVSLEYKKHLIARIFRILFKDNFSAYAWFKIREVTFE